MPKDYLRGLALRGERERVRDLERLLMLALRSRRGLILLEYDRRGLKLRLRLRE